MLRRINKPQESRRRLCCHLPETGRWYGMQPSAFVLGKHLGGFPTQADKPQSTFSSSPPARQMLGQIGEKSQAAPLSHPMISSPAPLQEGVHREPLASFHIQVQSSALCWGLTNGVLAFWSTLSLMGAPFLALAGHWQHHDSFTPTLRSRLAKGWPPSLLLGALIPCDVAAMTQVKGKAMSSP